jgi:hypothetical protein
MENANKPSMFQSTLTWGAITGLASIVYTLILYFLDLTLNKPAGYAGMLILVGGIFLGCKAYRDQSLDGYISYGKSLGTGVLISVFYAVITTLFMVILYKWIAPELVGKVMAQSQENMASKGMSEDQMEKGLEMTKKFFIVGLFIGGVFMSVFFGFLISLIVSIFIKKEGDPFNRDMSSVKSE